MSDANSLKGDKLHNAANNNIIIIPLLWVTDEKSPPSPSLPTDSLRSYYYVSTSHCYHCCARAYAT